MSENDLPDPEQDPGSDYHPAPEPGDITNLLNRMKDGDPSSQEAAFRAIYAHLRRLAAAYMRREPAGPTLQPTALVHEAYLRIASYSGHLQNRQHFFALAAEAMRRILVDYARARNAARRGGGARPEPLDYETPGMMDDPVRILAVNTALEQLQAVDARKAQLVTMRFFGGLSETEIAEVMGVHIRTVRREWVLAKAWLYAHLS